MQITAKISRGARKGEPLLPYRNKQGQYIVSPTKYKRDYIYVSTLTEVIDYLDLGLKLRMAPISGVAPSLKSPAAISIR